LCFFSSHKFYKFSSIIFVFRIFTHNYTTYYIGKLLNSEDSEEVKAGEKVEIFFPDSTNVNVSGVVMSKYSKNKDNATKFIEFMTGEKAQKAMTDSNYEYPANPSVEASELLIPPSWIVKNLCFSFCIVNHHHTTSCTSSSNRLKMPLSQREWH